MPLHKNHPTGSYQVASVQNAEAASCAGISTVTQNANWAGSQTQLNAELNEGDGLGHRYNQTLMHVSNTKAGGSSLSLSLSLSLTHTHTHTHT